MTSRLERSASYLILGLAALLALYPMGLILTTALGPDQVGAEGGIHVENFATAWELGNFGTYLKNSVIVSVAVVVLSAVLASLAGYAFGTMRFRGSNVLFYLLLLGLMVPSEAVVIPLYYDLRELNLTNTYVSLILPQVAQSLAFGTFWMRAYFRSASREVVEAARVDGAGHARIFWSILLPMGRPALMTMVLLIFMWTWNEFLIPLVMLVSNNNQTVSVAMGLTRGQNMSDPTLQAAASLLGMAPTLIFFLIFQRTLTRGVVVGAVK